MKNKKKYIIDIVPLTKIPLTTNQSFSYLYEKELAVGTLVEIPLFKRKVEGIVVGNRNDFERLGNIELKKVEKIICEKFLDEKQIELAKIISDYYISPLGVILKNFVPKRAKSRKNNVLSVKYEKPNIKLTEEQNKAVTEITKSQKSKPKNFLLFGPAGSGKTEVYIHSILKLKEKDKNAQFLILVPEKTLTPQALERYSEYFSQEEIVSLTSNLSKGKFFENFEKIKSGQAKIIIGTRMAVFAPFQKLNLIVIDEEQDMSFKQWDMNPRYDARQVAEKLAEIHGCSLVRGSATPSIESYWRTKNKKLNLITLPELKIKKTAFQKLETILVDMKKERWAKNYSCISKKLKAEIAYALKYSQQIILFINRQGMSSFSVCEGCKTVLRCPKCERSLVYDREGYYKCLHCKFKTDIIPKCTKCGGITFKNVGLGTQKVEKEILNLFPSAKILIADTSASKTKNFGDEVYEKFSSGEADILIGTQMISKGWDLPNVSLIGIIDTDNMLTFPDFRTEEKAFQILTQVSGRVNRPGARFPGVVIIQTFQPENQLVKMISERNFVGFFEQEIQERKALQLPPYGKIIKLLFQDYDTKKVDNEVLRVYEVLKDFSNIKITEPHIPLLSRIRGRTRKQIIIKSKEKIPEKLKREIEKLRNGWIIDIDPISII